LLKKPRKLDETRRMFDEATRMRMPGLRWGLVLGGLAVSMGWAQKADKVPQLLIHFSADTAKKNPEVAYMISAGTFYEYVMPEAQKKEERGPFAYEEDLSDMIAQESRKRQKRDEEKRNEKKERSYRF